MSEATNNVGRQLLMGTDQRCEEEEEITNAVTD
jgi:hypothetical protein